MKECSPSLFTSQAQSPINSYSHEMQENGLSYEDQHHTKRREDGAAHSDTLMGTEPG